MREKIKNLKTWFDENEEEMTVVVYGTGMLVIGYFMGSKLSEYRIAKGLSCLHDWGIMKFFDPTNGLEVDVDKLKSIVKHKMIE